MDERVKFIARFLEGEKVESCGSHRISEWLPALRCFAEIAAYDATFSGICDRLSTQVRRLPMMFRDLPDGELAS